MINSKDLDKFKRVPFMVQRMLYPIQFPRAFKHMLLKRYGVVDGNSIKEFIGTKIMFVHIPKCAGIALNHSLYGNKGGGHVGAYEYKLFFGERKFSDFFKVAIVRNPWDRVFSAYHFLKKGGRNANDEQFANQHLWKYESFEDFVMNWVDAKSIYSWIHFIPQYEFVCDPKDKIIVDHLGYYENLDSEYALITSKSLKPVPKELLKVNSTNTKENYRESFTQEMVDKIAMVYKKDIEILGYKF